MKELYITFHERETYEETDDYDMYDGIEYDFETLNTFLMDKYCYDKLSGEYHFIENICLSLSFTDDDACYADVARVDLYNKHVEVEIKWARFEYLKKQIEEQIDATLVMIKMIKEENGWE